MLKNEKELNDFSGKSCKFVGQCLDYYFQPQGAELFLNPGGGKFAI